MIPRLHFKCLIPWIDAKQSYLSQVCNNCTFFMKYSSRSIRQITLLLLIHVFFTRIYLIHGQLYYSTSILSCYKLLLMFYFIFLMANMFCYSMFFFVHFISKTLKFLTTWLIPPNLTFEALAMSTLHPCVR